MLCRMPAVILSDEFNELLNNSGSGTISDTQGPGVAAYVSPDGLTRVDIYIGLELDGFKLYRNMSAVNADIKMQFALKPVVSCPSNVITFTPINQHSVIKIQVQYAYIYTYLYT